MTKLYDRWQKPSILDASKTRRVLMLSGARQCGKTTLAKQLIEHAEYRTLDKQATREFALTDPQGFVKRENKLLIIDEIQRAPALITEIKSVVDEDNTPGQYFLTGSANVQALPSVQESLAGRVRNIRLRTLTQGEILGSAPDFLQNAFKQSFRNTSLYSRRAVIEMAFRGGFPEAIRLSGNERQQWHKDYMASLLERDLRDIARINRVDAMKKLVTILAAWSGKFMDISAIGAGLSIHRPTLETYILALEALYITETVPAWIHTDYERVGKRHKTYMADSGLMASLLRWRLDQVEFDSDRCGKLVETFIFNELAALIDVSNGEYELFHYRDREKREIDFIIERDDQSMIGIEIKAGSAISSSDFKHLKWFKENLAKERAFIGIVLYTGDQIGSMGADMWALPIGCLWS